MKQAHLFLHLEGFTSQNISEDTLENLLLLDNKKPKNRIYIPTDYYDKNDFLCRLAQYAPIVDIDTDITTAFAAMLNWQNDEYKDYEQFQADFQNDNYGLIGLDYIQKPIKKYVYDGNSWNELHCAFLRKNNEYIDWEKHKYFPNIDYAIQILEDELLKHKIDLPCEKDKNYQKKLTEAYTKGILLKLDKKQRNAYGLEIAEKIADRNFYKKTDTLTRCQSKKSTALRAIFYIEKINKTQFLSFDFEGCNAFEVCADDGTHLGEYLFDGSANKKAEEKGHSLSKDCIKEFKKIPTSKK